MTGMAMGMVTATAMAMAMLTATASVMAKATATVTAMAKATAKAMVIQWQQSVMVIGMAMTTAQMA